MVEVAAPWGPAASTNIAHGMVLNKLLKDHGSWVKISPITVSGNAKGVEYWETNKGQGVFTLIFTQGMMVEYAAGTGTYKRQGPRKDQGLLWPNYILDNFWVSREGSSYKTMADIKGAKIAMGEPGSSSLMATNQVLEYGLGLKPGDYKPVYAAIADIVSLFKEGTAQVASWANISTKGIPYPYLEDIAFSVKTHFIPHTQAMVDKMNKALGGDLYFLHTNPAGIYRNQNTDVPWVAQISWTTMPTMYSEDIAYELVRTWWDYHDEGIEINSRFGQSEPDMAKQLLKRKWPFDWHPGALKYYKEKGWA